MESIVDHYMEHSKEAAGCEHEHEHRRDVDNVSHAGSTDAIVQQNANGTGTGTGKGDPKDDKKNMTAKQKIKRHFRLYWLRHLIIFLVLLVILLPITFKVVIPAIVQSLIGQEQLPLNAGTFKPISSSQVAISLNTSLWSPLPVDMDSAPLYLYNKDTVPYSPFLALSLPKQHVNQETPMYLPETTVDLTNQDELVSWLSNVFDSKSTALSVRSDPTLWVSGMPNYPHLDKTIQMPGLNKFAGAHISGMTLLQPPEAGANIKGSITLPNWGVLALTLGNLTMDVYSGNVNLGYVSINDVVLPPGNTTKDFTGFLYLDRFASNLATIVTSQTDAFNRGMVQLNATGNSTIINGEHITYLESLLKSKKITMDISIVTLISNVVSGFIHGGNTTIPDAFQSVFQNNTLLNGIVAHWNQTGVTADGTSHAPRHVARGATRANMAWNLIKLGMKMNGMKR